MTEHEVLVAARNRLARVGWARSYGSAFGPMCLVHAVHYEASDITSVLREVAAVLGISPPDHRLGSRIGDWNDTVCGSEKEALGVLDRAIAATAPAPDTSFVTSPSSLIREEVVA